VAQLDYETTNSKCLCCAQPGAVCALSGDRRVFLTLDIIIRLHTGSQHYPKHDEDWEGPRLLSRRSFLNSTLGAGLASATSDQAAAPTTAVRPVRKRLIVDAQVHVWKAESADWPWIPALKPTMRAAPHRERLTLYVPP